MKTEELNQLVKVILGLIDKKQKQKRGQLQDGWWIATVDTFNGANNTATVIMPSETTPTSYKPNKTGQTLANGDEVYLFSPYGTLGSAWIAVAKKQYTNN